MANKPPQPRPRDIHLSPGQMRTAISRFERRIKEVEAFEPQKITDRRDPNIDALETSINEALDAAFGHDTPARRPYSPAATLDTAGINMNGTPHHQVIQGLMHGKERAIVLMKQAVRSFEERLAEEGENSVDLPVDEEAISPISRDVFVVHGRDDAAKEQVASVIRRAGLNAVILHEQPNGGATVIEKFEKHAGEAGFAVVIATPDDVGGLVGETQRPRARQNVIGEMFWFAGRLGRNRVCALIKGDIEMPSDIAGIVYTPMDDHGGWKSKLLQELTAAGYKDINWPAALT